MAENLGSILSVVRAVTPSLSIKIRLNENYENPSLDLRLLAQRFTKRTHYRMQLSPLSFVVGEDVTQSV